MLDGIGGKRFRQRNALEDFCTEALAWCLMNSESFAHRLFRLSCFKDVGFEPDSFEVDTQLSQTGFPVAENDDEDSEPSQQSRFDLVVRSSNPNSALMVIECKVAFDNVENIEAQIHKYRERLSRENAFKIYAKRGIVLLTPYADPHTADAHLAWNQVHDALRQTANSSDEPQRVVLKQFADFLKIKNLATMKHLPLTADSLPSLKKAAPLLVGLDAIFGRLRNPEVGRAIFRAADVRPKLEFNSEKGEDYLWYGIWSHGARPTYVVGFHTSCSGREPLSMSVQVMLDSNRTSEIPPKHLKQWYCQKDSGKEEDHTNFIFTERVEGKFDGNPAAIEEWLCSRLREIKEWVDKL
jgi:hypothetical protein